MPKGSLIVSITQYFECPHCDYSNTKHGESNRGWADMIERMHRKKCKGEGRTTYIKTTDEKRKDNLKRQGLSAHQATGSAFCEGHQRHKKSYSQNISSD